MVAIGHCLRVFSENDSFVAIVHAQSLALDQRLGRVGTTAQGRSASFLAWHCGGMLARKLHAYHPLGIHPPLPATAWQLGVCRAFFK